MVRIEIPEDLAWKILHTNHFDNTITIFKEVYLIDNKWYVEIEFKNG